MCNVLLSRDYGVNVGVILALASCPCKRRKQCLDILLSDWICALDAPDRERGICIEAMLRQPFCGIHSRWPVTEIVVKADRGRQRVGGDPVDEFRVGFHPYNMRRLDGEIGAPAFVRRISFVV